MKDIHWEAWVCEIFICGDGRIDMVGLGSEPCHWSHNFCVPVMAGMEASTYSLRSIHLGDRPFAIDGEGEGRGFCAPHQRVWPHIQVGAFKALMFRS